MKFAERYSALKPSPMLKLFMAAAADTDVAHLEIGEPDFTTEFDIIDEAARAAKDGYTQELLKLQLHTQTFSRIYAACCHCFVPLVQHFVNTPIARQKDSVLKREIRPDGAPALTYFQVLEQREERALLALRLATGRTHQIRVHMASIGWPLLGDFLYGQEEPDVIGRTALHSWHLSFLHPITGGQLEFTTPPPPDFTALFPHYRYPDPATLDFGKDTSC